MTCRTYSACVLHQKAVAVTLCRGMSGAARPQIQVDFLNGIPHRKHPGVTNLKTLSLPQHLQTAAQAILHGKEPARLADRALRLTNFLWSRKRAPDNKTLREKAMSLEKALREEAMKEGKDIETQLLETQIRKQVLSELRKTTHHWTPMSYDEEQAVVYMTARLAGGYAAVKRVLNEIKKRDPSFSPHSLLDFGSGLGTVLWASHSFWGDTLKEMVCVDSSGPMNSLAECLIKGGSNNGEAHIKQVYFRQFLPVSPKVQFDLVVGAFSLSELSSQSEREETLFTLWRKTSNYLVLVENGTKEGHHILMEARTALLEKQEQTVHDSRRPTVFAPCSHELACPKLSQLPTVPCNFNQLYNTLPLHGSPARQTERFSYLVFSRTGLMGASSSGECVGWARLTAPVQRRPRHVHCHVCCSTGELKQVVVTASRHGRDVYRCARNSDWGDQLPFIPEEHTHNHSQ